MSKSNKIGYISLIVGVILFALSFTVFEIYSDGNLMLETFMCISSMCLSRADIFFPVFIAGFTLLALGLALIGEDLVNNVWRVIFGK